MLAPLLLVNSQCHHDYPTVKHMKLITAEDKMGVNKVNINYHNALYVIIKVTFKCYFSREHIALSYEKWCEHRIRKNQQIKSTAHDEKSYLK